VAEILIGRQRARRAGHRSLSSVPAPLGCRGAPRPRFLGTTSARGGRRGGGAPPRGRFSPRRALLAAVAGPSWGPPSREGRGGRGDDRHRVRRQFGATSRAIRRARPVFRRFRSDVDHREAARVTCSSSPTARRAPARSSAISRSRRAVDRRSLPPRISTRSRSRGHHLRGDGLLRGGAAPAASSVRAAYCLPDETF
jgi:hypothetical protein